MQTGVRFLHGQTVTSLFDVDVTICVALFLTNILLVQPFENVYQSQNCQKMPCFATAKISNVSVTSEIIRYFFTVEKYQFYSHLICIEFTACDKINLYITLLV